MHNLILSLYIVIIVGYTIVYFQGQMSPLDLCYRMIFLYRPQEISRDVNHYCYYRITQNHKGNGITTRFNIGESGHLIRTL